MKTTSRNRSNSSPPRMETSSPAKSTPKSEPKAEARPKAEAQSAPKTQAHAEPKAQDAKPQLLKREDNYFTDSTFQKNGKDNKKSHLSMEPDNRGNLVPVAKEGKTTPYGHVQGDAAQKQKSPYTSFSPGEHQDAKHYGDMEMEVNRTKLEQDIKNGKLPGVEVLDNSKVQKGIMDEIHKNMGVRVDKPVPHAEIPQFVAEQKQQLGLSKKKEQGLERRMQALANTNRDQEVLVKGEIPSQYVRRVGLNQDKYSKLTTELKAEVARREEKKNPPGTT